MSHTASNAYGAGQIARHLYRALCCIAQYDTTETPQALLNALYDSTDEDPSSHHAQHKIRADNKQVFSAKADLCRSSRFLADTGCRCLNQWLLQAGAVSAGHTAQDHAHRQGVSYRHAPVPQAVCSLPHPCVGPQPLERLEPDPVQYVPAWHRLQETEELAPATLPSDAESSRLKRVD